jgi:predicted nucleic acid-binding protein
VIFVDTGAFVARHVERDQDHRRAQNGWRELAVSCEPCVTSNFVLDETLTLLGRRAGYAFAAQRGIALMSSKALAILRPTAEDEWKAIELFRKYGDQRVSFTDCVSFVLMRRAGIGRAFTFDRHFAFAGFQVWPG